ncbi:MAG: methyltransferase domain-containing protein [Acidobacteriota bacterium]|nr:methyltransferase domain-containing protein [Acidobacteriota bacterium]
MTTSNPQIDKWETRYKANATALLKAPLDPIVEATTTLKPGKALDLACGPGRHAVWLAQRGWDVDAVDGSSAALHQLLNFANTNGCSHRIHTICADLEAKPSVFQVPKERYDLIINCHFLHRPLFEAIQHGIRDGGYFIGIIHSAIAAPSSNENNYLVQPGELKQLVQDWRWEIISSREENKRGNDTQLADSIIVARRPNRQSQAVF